MKKRMSLLAVLVLVVAVPLIYVFAPTKRSRAGEGPQVILYTGENFTGKAIALQGTVYDLPLTPEQDGTAYDWNDQVRSLVVVGGTWRLYQNGRCNTRLDETKLDEFDIRGKLPDEGWCALVSATSRGQYEVPDVSAAGIGKDMSSIELISTENLPDWAMGLRKP
jgi:hypothetical protein